MTVKPAQNMGAAASELTFSGTKVQPRAAARMSGLLPPPRVTHESDCWQ
jgi:hypothetical protein